MAVLVKTTAAQIAIAAITVAQDATAVVTIAANAAKQKGFR